MADHVTQNIYIKEKENILKFLIEDKNASLHDIWFSNRRYCCSENYFIKTRPYSAMFIKIIGPCVY